ncbi:MAG TPA: hypothetical protein DD735_05600, partial [Clostridiales bacterium]|nr:hypothetical protein [Clostridiales bacterium]
PKGRVKGVLRVVCGAVMITVLISPVAGFDFAVYSESLGKYRIKAEAAAGRAAEAEDILSRSIIERECAAYILDKAAALELTASSADVSAKWSDGGFWYPYEAGINVSGGQDAREKLAEIIESDLGIPRDRQYWGANCE